CRRAVRYFLRRMRINNFAGGTGVFQEGRMLLFSPLGQCRVELCDFDPNEVWTSCKQALAQKRAST
ncbi:hypothetical protein, partial [Shewanella denitrificans]|uniref:hypothetical protein n=1 Tax=Shewanella denitrificans TaxID=192073 RepID=UPI0039F13A2B